MTAVARIARQVVWPLLLVAGGVVLMAAGRGGALPTNYWQQPEAAVASLPQGWSPLEGEMHPEACAQCHAEQFDAWRGSRHARAYSPGMIGQFVDMGHAGGNDCLVCHAPLKQQLFRSDAEMNRSLALALRHPDPVERDADLAREPLPLRHSGVSCAVCHVRQGQRFGPPRKGSDQVGWQAGAAHGGFTASRQFEASQFCASCHQFPQSMAINGKPLENTLTEWRDSPFFDQGVSCQSCHMPDRRHAFRGIHDPAMTKKGLRFAVRQTGEGVRFEITSVWIGHAFPTYVTPSVVVESEARDGGGALLAQWRWEIGRQVVYREGWRELRDTRIMPGETRAFIPDHLPAETVEYRVRVRVIPDQYYIRLYRLLLADGMTGNAGRLIRRALDEASKRDYLLYQQSINMKQRTSRGGSAPTRRNPRAQIDR